MSSYSVDVRRISLGVLEVTAHSANVRRLSLGVSEVTCYSADVHGLSLGVSEETPNIVPRSTDGGGGLSVVPLPAIVCKTSSKATIVILFTALKESRFEPSRVKVCRHIL